MVSQLTPAVVSWRLQDHSTRWSNDMTKVAEIERIRWAHFRRNRRRLHELAVAQQEAEAQAMQDRDNDLYLEEQAVLQAWQRGEAAGMALTWTKY